MIYIEYHNYRGSARDAWDAISMRDAATPAERKSRDGIDFQPCKAGTTLATINDWMLDNDLILIDAHRIDTYRSGRCLALIGTERDRTASQMPKSSM